jgi:hypothetical protein
VIRWMFPLTYAASQDQVSDHRSCL